MTRFPQTVRDAVLARSAPARRRCARAPRRGRGRAFGRPSLAPRSAVPGRRMGALDQRLASGMLVRRSHRRRLPARAPATDDRGFPRTRTAPRPCTACTSPVAGDTCRSRARPGASGPPRGGGRGPRGGPPAMRPGRQPGGARSARIARLRPSTRALSASPMPSPLTSAPKLLRLRADECYLDRPAGGGDRLCSGPAAACYRELGDRLGEGRSILFVSSISWCPGRDRRRLRRPAGPRSRSLEPLGPGLELAQAYGNVASLRRDGDDQEARARVGVEGADPRRRAGGRRDRVRAAPITIAMTKALHGDRDAISDLQAENGARAAARHEGSDRLGLHVPGSIVRPERLYPLRARDRPRWPRARGRARVPRSGGCICSRYRARIELEQEQGPRLPTPPAPDLERAVDIHAS